MNKIKIPLAVTLCSGLLFTLLQISFHLDISILSFFISAAISFFMVRICYFKFFKNQEEKSFVPCQKLLQYSPYVYLISFIVRRAGKSATPYWYDLVTVLLWTCVLIVRYFVLYYMNDKRAGQLNPAWKKEKKGSSLIVKPAGKKRVLFEIVDWIDALVQSVFMVLIFQIFVLQLYVIPSESMVPAFLVKDRVVVLKTPSGPKMPLCDVGLPCVKKYKRGDVVVFRNPHYRMDRKSEVRTVVSQLIYMLSFSTINLNVDERGEVKADPLVKRITGLPGEQLVMVDGVLYSRTAKSDEFKKVDLDEKFARSNLNVLPADIKRGVETIPLSQENYDRMLYIEEERNKLDIDSVAFECASIVSEIRRLNSLYLLKNENADFDSSSISLYEESLFMNSDEIARGIYTSKKGLLWFSDFMTSWIKDKKVSLVDMSNDLYAQSNYRLNLMVKLTFGRLLLQKVLMLSNGKNLSDSVEDIKIQNLLKTAGLLDFYLRCLDARAMPVFPACSEDGNPVYIPENCYFMMGDNRFNSLDMRHSYAYKELALTKYDPYSVSYMSNMAPQYVNKKYILGTTFYRFWPLHRRGIIKVN